MQHTTAVGITPFDQEFKTGYTETGFTSREEGFSPIKRTNILRKNMLDGEYLIDAQRAILVTESYKATEGEPMTLRRAKALKHILSNINIYTYEKELIVGNHGAPNNSPTIFPEFAMDWIIDEMDNHPFSERPFDCYDIAEETKEELRSVADYWKGKTICEKIESSLTPDQKKFSNVEGIATYLLVLSQYGGIGHYVMNYERLLELGYTGFIKEIQKKKEDTSFTQEQQEQLDAMIISMEACIIYAERYAEAYEELAKKESDKEQKAEYEQIASNMRSVAAGAPTNFWEAEQLVFFTTNVAQIETNAHSVSYGRLDQYLYPFYKKDLDSGKFTKEFMQSIIEAHYIKITTAIKIRDRGTSISHTGRGFGGEAVTLGGVDRDGNDATNDLTMMMIDAIAHTRTQAPWSAVRWHKNSPYELKVKTFSVIKCGCGHPKVFNDQAAVQSLVNDGRTLEDARNYGVIGCVEPTVGGMEYDWADSGMINLDSIFEMAINDGKSLVAGGAQLGLKTGSLADMTSIEDVKKAYDTQMKYIVDLFIDSINLMDEIHQDMMPTPFVSVFFDNCIETATDIARGGAQFNHSGPQGIGVGSVADAMSNIDYLVFKEKKYTGAEMLDAMAKNFEGYDKLLAELNSSKIPHYGNDDDYADSFAEFTFDSYCKHVMARTCPRKEGSYRPGFYGTSVNISFGLYSAASLSGRRAGEPISDNMGPVHTRLGSHDVSGPTAVANSVTKMDHPKASNGTLLNWKFSKNSIAGKTGTDNLIRLMDTYFDRKGFHSQFNIMSSATMKKALENPEKYKDMLVRVAGYSAYFVQLSPQLQQDLIERTELSF